MLPTEARTWPTPSDRTICSAVILRAMLGDQSELILVLLLAGILLVLFTPIPPQLLDFLLISNFSFALLILLLTFYMARPLEFSTFPSLLLGATLFRLGLNISATRLILSEANAGRVIVAIGEHVVGGNYVIGLIVFLVLIIVQFVVVTSGAQRVAEVAARFTLDSMPGKQMSIDADLNMGLIGQDEARERRRQIERESNFYGAMDGASRFVKGDAIAGILLIIVNVIGGLSIGVGQHGMSWGEALSTYTLLTVGDGIVTQIPALVIAIATGIIVTRAASDARLGAEVARQVLAHPRTIAILACTLLALASLPGIPLWPIAVLLPLTVGLYLFARQRGALTTPTASKPAPAASGNGGAEDLYRALKVDPVEVALGSGLLSVVGEEGAVLAERLTLVRKQYSLDMGVVLPLVRVRDEKRLAPGHYEVRIFGTRVGDGVVHADRLLAINPGNVKGEISGVPARDPAYGLPAVWITEEQRASASSLGFTVVDAETVFMTHTTELLKQNAHNLITRAEAERLVARVRENQASLVDELVPKVLSYGDIQRVLQSLVRERVPIRNIDAILEVLADHGGKLKEPEALTEVVRERLGPLICQQFADAKGELSVITFEPAVEQALAAGVRAVDDRPTLILEPRYAEQVLRKLSEEIERLARANTRPVLLCAPTLRRHVRRFTERLVPQLVVLSLNEVPTQLNLRSAAVVRL